MYFYQIKCCFYIQNGCMNKQILQRLIPSQIPDRFSKLLCNDSTNLTYFDKYMYCTIIASIIFIRCICIFKLQMIFYIYTCEETTEERCLYDY
jgi:hypothetical protein